MSKSPSYLLIFIVLCFSCKKEEFIEYDGLLLSEKGEEYSAGQGTIFDVSVNAFSHQLPGLTGRNQLLFFVGNSFFNQNWVSAPASTTARDGLGPFFNARACSSCHFKDGRGKSSPGRYDVFNSGLLLRLSIPGKDSKGASIPEPTYGGQLQDQSISRVTTQGGFSVNYSTIVGNYSDGTTYTLRKPDYIINHLAYGPLDPSVMISPRVAPQMIGLGFLEAISDYAILLNEDEHDINGDGISGKANYVWDYEHQRVSLGRFGWKANQPSLLQQTCGAFSGDMGITTFLFPDPNCAGTICDTLPNGGSPEIDDDDLLKVVLYSSTLAVPARRNWNNQSVLRGKERFNEIGCASCHIAKFKTKSTHYLSPALTNQVIRPYTDLLLHDMGEELADNRPDFKATGREWRTPPLWGIGLIETVNGHTELLHDGRARNVEEAILWHGGEGKTSREKFKHLSKEEREDILNFINSL